MSVFWGSGYITAWAYAHPTPGGLTPTLRVLCEYDGFYHDDGSTPFGKLTGPAN